MPRINGTTNAQSKFLRAFRTHPFGPPPEDWPSPAILRRWLRRPGFHRAFLDLRTAIRMQADFHLAATSATAAHRLAQRATASQDSGLSTQDYLHALRLAHLRQRFPTDPPLPPAPAIRIVNILRNSSSDTPISEILEELEKKRLIPEQPHNEPSDSNPHATHARDEEDDEDTEAEYAAIRARWPEQSARFEAEYQEKQRQRQEALNKLPPEERARHY
jgi:hypothetical protein